MPNNFLLWFEPNQNALSFRVKHVAAGFQKYLSSLYGYDVKIEQYRNGGINLLYYPLPPVGWLPSYVQQDKKTWAVAFEYPLNGHVLAGFRNVPKCLTALPDLARCLQKKPDAVLNDLYPPALLFWEDKLTKKCFLINDGLGAAQLFEYRYREGIALSDRIFAFKALNLPLQPDLDEWTFKSNIGFFPMEMSGYKNIRYVKPATMFIWNRSGYESKRHPSFPEWVRQEPKDDLVCYEMARKAMMDYVADTSCLYSEASGGLSGGYDSRTVFSTFKALDLPLQARVKGPPEKYDVIVAKELAKRARLNLKVKSEAELPSNSVQGLRRSIEKSILWQSGYMYHEKLITFLQDAEALPRGSVNVTGQEGEVARGKYRIKPIEKFKKRMADQLRAHRRLYIESVLEQMWEEEIIPLELNEAHQGDAIYLYEHIRRLVSGSLHGQTGQIISPFDSIDLFRAVFSYCGDTVKGEPFHRYIIGKNAPDWLNVPFEKDLLNKTDSRSRKPDVNADWRIGNGRYYFNRDLYWNTVGKSLMDEARDAGRIWREIFEKEWLEQSPSRYADVLTMLYELERLT